MEWGNENFIQRNPSQNISGSNFFLTSKVSKHAQNFEIWNLLGTFIQISTAERFNHEFCEANFSVEKI
jgi:hypothetical protein